MRHAFCLFLIAALATVLPAQTVGVAGINDLTVNGVGSGGASCVPVYINAGDPWNTALDALPFSSVVAATATHCVFDTIILDPDHAVDLDFNTLNIAFDGTGTIVANGLTFLAQTNSAGQFVFSINTSEIYRNTFAYQTAVVNPYFPLGIGTTQGFEITIGAPNLVPNGTDIPVSDDGSVNHVFAQPFAFYGSVYTDVWINMNGNLTFGTGDSDFTPSESEFLSDQPRIAPAWDDWSPNIQGTVRVDDSGGMFQVEWHDVVPYNFPSTQCQFRDTNTFMAALTYASGNIQLGYGPMLFCQQGLAPTTDHIVGVSPGGNLSGMHNIDLTGGPHFGGANLAMYEDFGQATYGPFDMSHITCCLNQFVTFAPSSGGYDQSIL